MIWNGPEGLNCKRRNMKYLLFGLTSFCEISRERPFYRVPEQGSVIGEKALILRNGIRFQGHDKMDKL